MAQQPSLTVTVVYGFPGSGKSAHAVEQVVKPYLDTSATHQAVLLSTSKAEKEEARLRTAGLDRFRCHAHSCHSLAMAWFGRGYNTEQFDLLVTALQSPNDRTALTEQLRVLVTKLNAPPKFGALTIVIDNAHQWPQKCWTFLDCALRLLFAQLDLRVQVNIWVYAAPWWSITHQRLLRVDGIATYYIHGSRFIPHSTACQVWDWIQCGKQSLLPAWVQQQSTADVLKVPKELLRVPKDLKQPAQLIIAWNQPTTVDSDNKHVTWIRNWHDWLTVCESYARKQYSHIHVNGSVAYLPSQLIPEILCVNAVPAADLVFTCTKVPRAVVEPGRPRLISVTDLLKLASPTLVNELYQKHIIVTSTGTVFGATTAAPKATTAALGAAVSHDAITRQLLGKIIPLLTQCRVQRIPVDAAAVWKQLSYNDDGLHRQQDLSASDIASVLHVSQNLCDFILQCATGGNDDQILDPRQIVFERDIQHTSQAVVDPPDLQKVVAYRRLLVLRGRIDVSIEMSKTILLELKCKQQLTSADFLQTALYQSIRPHDHCMLVDVNHNLVYTVQVHDHAGLLSALISSLDT